MDLIEKISNLLDSDIVYHYTKKDTALEDILLKHTLRPFPLKTSNDPIEYNSKTLVSVSAIGDTEARDKSSEIRQRINERNDNAKFISFCRNKTDNLKELQSKLKNKSSDSFHIDNKTNVEIVEALGCILPRMWSQYGEEHEGVCLAFSLKELIKEIKTKLDDKTNVELFSHKISYNSCPVIDSSAICTDLSRDGEIKIEEYVDNFIKENYKNLFFKKHKDYKDENEHRIVIDDPEDNFRDIDITSSLRAIILGDNFEKYAYEDLIKKFTENYDVFYCETRWSNGTIIFK